MLDQPILSLIARMIPEAFLVIYSIYRLTNSKVDMKKIMISGILGGIGVYVIRLFPIHFGVHTIIAIMLYIILAVKFNKIEIYKAIAVALVLQIILFISDFIIFIIYTEMFQFSANVLFGTTWIAAIAGMPPLILFYLFVLMIVNIKKKREFHE